MTPQASFAQASYVQCHSAIIDCIVERSAIDSPRRRVQSHTGASRRQTAGGFFSDQKPRAASEGHLGHLASSRESVSLASHLGDNGERVSMESRLFSSSREYVKIRTIRGRFAALTVLRPDQNGKVSFVTGSSIVFFVNRCRLKKAQTARTKKIPPANGFRQGGFL